jgi:hypothetical protein
VGAAALGCAAVEAVEDEFDAPREHPSTMNEAEARVDATIKITIRPIRRRRGGFIDLTLVSLLKICD